jgi:hypothetical protein
MLPQPPLPIITTIQAIQVITQAGIILIMVAGAVIAMPGTEIVYGEADGGIMVAGVTMAVCIGTVVGMGTVLAVGTGIVAVAGTDIVAAVFDIANKSYKARLQNGTGMQAMVPVPFFIRLLNTPHYPFQH